MKSLTRFIAAGIGLMTAAMLCSHAFPLHNDSRPIDNAAPYLLLALAVLKALDIVDSWLYEWEPKEDEDVKPDGK